MLKNKQILRKSGTKERKKRKLFFFSQGGKWEKKKSLRFFSSTAFPSFTSKSLKMNLNGSFNAEAKQSRDFKLAAFSHSDFFSALAPSLLKLSPLRREAVCYSLFCDKKMSIGGKQTGFRLLRHSTIDWHCTKPLARNQLGLWFSFMVQPFSTRKHWWILLPSQNLLFRLRWETSEKTGAQAPNFYSVKDFVEFNNLNVAHLNWFSEKPFYFYVIVPFLGCLGLIYASLNSNGSIQKFSFGETQKTSETLFPKIVRLGKEKSLSFFPSLAPDGAKLVSPSPQFLEEKNSDFFSHFEFNPIFEDKMSWETLNYLNYKKNLLNIKGSAIFPFKEDCGPLDLQKTNFYHDKIVYELSSTWFNYVQEQYIGTYAQTSCYENYLNSSTLFLNLKNSSFLKENSNLGEFISERFLLKKNKWREQNGFITPLQGQIFESWWTKKSFSQIYSTINSNSKMAGTEGVKEGQKIKPFSHRDFSSLEKARFLKMGVSKLSLVSHRPQLKFSSFNKLKKQKKSDFFLKVVFKNEEKSGAKATASAAQQKKQILSSNFMFSSNSNVFSIWENYLSQKSKIHWFWYKWCLNDVFILQNKTSRNLCSPWKTSLQGETRIFKEVLPESDGSGKTSLNIAGSGKSAAFSTSIGHSNYKINFLPFFEEKKGKTIVQRKTSPIHNTQIKSLFFNEEFAQKLFSGNLSLPKNYLSNIENSNSDIAQSKVSLPFYSQLNRNVIIKLGPLFPSSRGKMEFFPSLSQWEKKKSLSFFSSSLAGKAHDFFSLSEERFSSPRPNFCFDSLILINGLKSKTNNMKEFSFPLKKKFKEKKMETKPVEFYGLFGRKEKKLAKANFFLHFKNNFNYMNSSLELLQKYSISPFSENLDLNNLASAFPSSELYSFQSFSDYFTAAFFFDNAFYKFFLDNKKVNFLKSNSLFLSKNNNKMVLNSKAKRDEISRKEEGELASSPYGLFPILSPKKLNFPILLSGYFFPLKKNDWGKEEATKRKRFSSLSFPILFSKVSDTMFQNDNTKKIGKNAPLKVTIPPYFLHWQKNKMPEVSLESFFPIKTNNDYTSVQKNSFTTVFSVPNQNASKELKLLTFFHKKKKLPKANLFPFKNKFKNEQLSLINNFIHPDRKKSIYQSTKLKWKSVGKWSFYWNYFYHFYGSSSFFKPWSSMFDSTNVNKHSHLFFKKILSPFSGLNNLTGQNIFFKKWHSKKKEGFFYKRITKLELKKTDLNPAKYSRVVSLLWGFRSKYKLDEVLQYQKSKYYQSKKAQQTANQNIDQTSTDSKINKQIVIKTLNKRRRYKRYLELDVLSSWLRDILYFRKMCRKLVPIKKDSYLFNINNRNQNFDFQNEKKSRAKEGKKLELFSFSQPDFQSDGSSETKSSFATAEWGKASNLRKDEAFPHSFFNSSRVSNLLLFKKRKNSFFNVLERNNEWGKEKSSGFFLSKITKNNRDKRKNKQKSYNTSKKLFLSLKKFIRVKNFYQTIYSNKKLKQHKMEKGNKLKLVFSNKKSEANATPLLSDFKQSSYSFENFKDSSKFLNKIAFNDYSYFSNSLLFNSTPASLKKICLNFSNKRLLKINWKKKFIKRQKSGEFTNIKKAPDSFKLFSFSHSDFYSTFSFDEIFLSIFKNLNRFFIYLKKIMSRQLFIKVNNFFYSGKNSFFVKNELPTTIKTSSHLFENQTKLTNRIRLNKFWIKQDNFEKAGKNENHFISSNNLKNFSSVSNLLKINIKRSFLKKVSTFSTTVNKPSSLNFNFFSERKLSGNLDFILYRKNKRMRNKKATTDKKLFPFSFYGFKHTSFEELMTKFKNLSSSFVIWRNKFEIRRDYLLLSYIYLDYLGALVNSVNCSSVVFNNSISSNISLVNFLSGNLEWQKISEKNGNEKNLSNSPLYFNNHISKNSFNYLEIFKNEQNYLLYAQHYKSNCLKPVWSFSIVNHLKINHLAVYEQFTNFSEELKSFNKKTNNIEIKDELKQEGEKERIFSSFPFLASSFPQFSHSSNFAPSVVLHRSIKNSKDFVKSFFFKNEALLIPFHDSATYNKNYLHYKNNILKKKLLLLKNQQKYLFAVNFFKNKVKYRRKSGIYNSRIVNKQTKIYNGVFLSNLQVGLKDNELILSNISNNNFNPIKINFSQIKVLTFWLCTLLFHVCLISSLLTSYKSSIHFCIKTLYSSLFVLNKYFVYTKYRIKRLINYIYQNNFEYLIETIAKYFSIFKPSRMAILNSFKFPDSFIQLESIKENTTIKKSGGYERQKTKSATFLNPAFSNLNKISLKKINFSQLFFLPYYFSLEKWQKKVGFFFLCFPFLKFNIPHKNLGKRRDFYFSSFSSKILGLFQYVQYKYQTPFTTLKFNENNLDSKKILNTFKLKVFKKRSFLKVDEAKKEDFFLEERENMGIPPGSKASGGTFSQLDFFPSQIGKVNLKNFQSDLKISNLLSPFSFSLLNDNYANLKLQNERKNKLKKEAELGEAKDKEAKKLKKEKKAKLFPLLPTFSLSSRKKEDFFLEEKENMGISPGSEASGETFSHSDFSPKFNFNLLEKKQLNLLKTNLTDKLSKEKNLKVYFKVLQWNMLITLLIGESEVLAELEPYREMHWYFLKKFPIFLRTSSGKDYLSMSDYQADEKIRIIKQKIRQTIMILYLRSRKYESKLQNRSNQSEKKTSYLLKNRLNQKGQRENSSSLKFQNQNKSFVSEKKNTAIKESSFSSFEKLVKTVFNFLYSLSLFSQEKKIRRQKIKKLSPWKSILTFLGKYSFVTRSAILNKRFRESLMLFSQPLISFGPIGTIFIPYGIKNFLLRFDQIDYQKNKDKNQDFFSVFYLQKDRNKYSSIVNKETHKEFPVYMKKMNKSQKLKKEKSLSVLPSPIGEKNLEFAKSDSSYLEKLNFYIMGKINKELSLSNADGRKKKKNKNAIGKAKAKEENKLTKGKKFALANFFFPASASSSLLINKKNLFSELDSSPLFELEFLTNLQKLIKKYNRVYYGFNHMKNNKKFELISNIDSSDYSSFFPRNLSLKNVKPIITESNLYDWTYSDSSNRLGKNSMYFDTFDPKLRYYRFSTNFSKVLSDVGGLYTNFSAHQEFGPLICKVYTGLFSKQSAKNYLLVSGPTNNESVLFLVQALAAEIGMKLFMEDAKRLQRIGRRGINKATKRLEKLFDIAQANVPALVFIEDIHVIGSKTKMVKVDEEQDDVEILARSLLSKLVYRKYHKNKSLREAFIDQNLLTGGSAVLRRRSLKPTNPIPKSLVLYQLTRRRAFSNFFKSQDNASRKINTKLFVTKKLSPAFTTNAVLIWKLFKSKIATPNKRIKESPWYHIPVDAMRSIHPLTYSIRVKVAKITLLAIFTMGTRLRLVKDLIRLFEKTHYNSHQNFIVFATTNKLSTLDPSLRRPGRLEEIISLYSLTGVSSSSRSPAFMSVLDTFKVYLKNVPGFSKTFNLIDNTLFSSNLNLKEWSLINYLAEASYYSFYSSKNSFESNSLNTVDFYQNLLQSEEKREFKKEKSFSFFPFPISPSSHFPNKALKYFIFSSLNFHSGSNDSFENKDFTDMKSRFYSEKNLFVQKLQIKSNFVSKTVTTTQLKKQRMTSFETKSKVNAAFSAGNLFTSQNSHSSNNSDYWQLIFSNITLQRKKGGFDFSNNFNRLNQTYSKNKNIYLNNRYKKYNKSNLFLTLAYSRSGQSLISFLLNYKKSVEQKRLKSKAKERQVKTKKEEANFSNPAFSHFSFHKSLKQFVDPSNNSFLFFDSDYLTNLQLWPETVNINSLKPQNTFYNRRKNLQSYFLRFFSSKVGELLFTNSIVWNLGWEKAKSVGSSLSLTVPTGNENKNYILDQGGFLNNIYGITPDWTCAYSYIKNVVTTSSLYSKTPLISKLLRLEDVSKPRQKQFFESLNAGMLFEYSDFHYRAFFKKNNLSTEENLNLLIFQKYMLNNQGRPLRKYVKLENSNRLWLFRILYTELGTLDNISLRPTSMNYYYRNKIILKQSFKLSSYQWWNWHLRKPLEQLEDVQEIAYFPCENKYYNPRHRRWILTNGFWGYWFSFDKNFYFDLYEQYMFQSFHIAYLHLDQNREILDYLSKLYICREKLSETDLILSFKRYKI
uniref:Cell division protein n=1 Tax=Stigeoclonium helveticum TaxID=55999 RepID=Q06SI5_STIHE|nr:cell division protein [Stigeoclonium helveticum]ABF60158.1 cell division protein [Stigeoclonium helveticum]